MYSKWGVFLLSQESARVEVYRDCQTIPPLVALKCRYKYIVCVFCHVSFSPMFRWME